MFNMEEIFSLPPLAVFDNNYQTVLEFMDTLGNPKFKIAGDVDLYMNKEIKSLGNLVEVEGYVDIEFTNIKELPENLKIKSYLLLMGNNEIKELPNGLSVSTINAQGTNINKINNITVNQHAIFSYMFNLKSLPDNFNVPGSLNLISSGIRKIPKNLIVGENLFIKGTPLLDKLIYLCNSDDEELILDYLNNKGCNINNLIIY